ncbi:prepilin-type N-terminal cleavage/methylation domain-containing protein [Sulfuricaulis sp.]|jgi:Tfp pilus assembly protein PilV|uniref:type IV pilus modification PilV family protein n=1 Tax=Sulfuricaulis sp. TaxID=2003553 RepID=UPI003559B339
MKRHPAILKYRANQAGVTLVELIVFIVVVALLAIGLIAAFTSSMKDTPASGDVSQALQLAQERMELILAYKQSRGFNALIDPCTLGSPPTQCTSFPSGFNVPAATIVNNWNGSSEYKVITVNVTGPQTLAVTALVASY